jgi:hypothetical protein
LSGVLRRGLRRKCGVPADETFEHFRLKNLDLDPDSKIILADLSHDGYLSQIFPFSTAPTFATLFKLDSSLGHDYSITVVKVPLEQEC